MSVSPSSSLGAGGTHVRAETLLGFPPASSCHPAAAPLSRTPLWSCLISSPVQPRLS